MQGRGRMWVEGLQNGENDFGKSGLHLGHTIDFCPIPLLNSCICRPTTCLCDNIDGLLSWPHASAAGISSTRAPPVSLAPRRRDACVGAEPATSKLSDTVSCKIWQLDPNRVYP